MPTRRSGCRCCWFWDCLIPFTKFWGILTSVVLCGVGVDILVHRHSTGIYIILATLGIFFLEIAWIVTLFLKVCIHDEYSNILSCWNGVLWIKEWRKTIIYVAFAFFLFLKPSNLWLSHVAGIMLMILGILHFLLCWSGRASEYRKEPLLDSQDNYLDKYDIGDTDIAIAKGEANEGVLNNQEEDERKLDI